MPRFLFSRRSFASLLLPFMLGLAANGYSSEATDASAPITVFAAASMTDVLQAMAADYKTRTGKSVRFSFAASSVLARQIEAGAVADIFISADTDWMDYLDKHAELDVRSRRNLISNRLVLVAPINSPIALDLRAGVDVAGALGARGRLAMADPEYVPAGRYGRTALIRLGAWSSVADRLARTENVRAALAFVARGETPLGIVYQSDAKVEPRVRTVGVFPGNSHPLIVYPAALTRHARKNAQAFLDDLSRPEAVATFVKFGFVPL